MSRLRNSHKIPLVGLDQLAEILHHSFARALPIQYHQTVWMVFVCIKIHSESYLPKPQHFSLPSLPLHSWCLIPSFYLLEVAKVFRVRFLWFCSFSFRGSNSQSPQYVVHCQSLDTNYRVINFPANGECCPLELREFLEPGQQSGLSAVQTNPVFANQLKKKVLAHPQYQPHPHIPCSLPLSLQQKSSGDVSKLAHQSTSYSACSSNFPISSYSSTVVYTLRVIILNLPTNWTALFPFVIRPGTKHVLNPPSSDYISAH